jgi:hypothetical protein
MPTGLDPDPKAEGHAGAYFYDWQFSGCKHSGPALVEVLVSRQELSMPPTITYEQAKNFGLFMLTAVLNGRGDEIVDLAKVNLLR